MKTAAIIAAALVAATITTGTAQAAGRATFFGGGYTCGKWTKERAERDAFHMETYVLGFVSGLNMSQNDATPDALRGTDADSIHAWVDNYCRANPLDKLQAASYAVYDQLLARKYKGI